MADLIRKVSTTLPPEEVLVRAVQFFTNEKWRAQSQTNRIATFIGLQKVPILKILILFVLFFFFVIPGIIYYFFVIRSLRKLQNIVVTTTPMDAGCSVIVTYPKDAQRFVDGFLAALPQTVPTLEAADPVYGR
jgi:p-aminobenzoyl-glutamate transporter AbgT